MILHKALVIILTVIFDIIICQDQVIKGKY